MNGFRTETRSDTEAQGIWEIFLYSREINAKSKGHKSKTNKKRKLDSICWVPQGASCSGIF